MKYYPIYLNIANKRCIVVGGGEVAERKARRLLACGARVVVVAKTLTPLLEREKQKGAIEHRAADYDDSCLDGAVLVIGATNRDRVNGKIASDAKARGIPVNIVDDPARCDFILPSLFQRGDLLIAISTGGKSPALAKKLRKELAEHYGPEYAVLLDILGEVRKTVVARRDAAGAHKELFERLINSDVLAAIRSENWERVQEIVGGITGCRLDAERYAMNNRAERRDRGREEET